VSIMACLAANAIDRPGVGSRLWEDVEILKG
jgi:hypothetical protein